MSIESKRRYAAAAFATLLILSVFWPSPIVSSNRLWLERDLDVDELSFLGREALSWDVVFWCLAGLLALAILQTGDFTGWRSTMRLSVERPPRWVAILAAVAIGIVVVLATWWLADAPVLAWAEQIQSETTEDIIRIVNRLGGGMNPVMIVVFFLLAGLAYRHRPWVSWAVAMAMAGAGAGLIAHALKFVVGRTRPELWLGPFHYARAEASSFPSGHTVGAFALAGVLVFGSRNLALRIIALTLACAVGLSRILAFRHWASDVVASAAIGLLCAWIATSLFREEKPAG